MSHAEDVDGYIQGVITGSIVTGRLERMAVHRHLDDLKFAQDRGFVFEAKYAIDAIDFAENCNQFEGDYVGLPLQLRPEQKFVVWCLFGWREKATGLRRFRHMQCEVARKWGKTTIVAYLACLLLYADWPLEYGAQGYVAATELEQSSLCWNHAKIMVEQSPSLKKRSRISDYSGSHKIYLPALRSSFKPLAAKKTPDGFNPHFIIKDEEHAWRENHRGQAKTLKSGFGARKQPLTITITTYGSDDSVLWIENHDYAVRILESVITGEIVNDQWFVFICAIDFPVSQPCFRCLGKTCPWCHGTGDISPDEPYDETIWRKANPGIGNDPGCTPILDRMRESATEARGMAETQVEFFQKNLNIKVASLHKLISADAWAACEGTLSDWMTADRIHGGIDMARSNDMAGAAPVARFDLVDDANDKFIRFEIRSRAFTCKDRPEEIDTPQIKRWVEDGLLHESEGNQIWFSEVEKWVALQSTLWNVATWAFDPKFATEMGQILQEQHYLTVYPFPQHHGKYNEPLRTLLRKLTEVHIVNGEPVRALVHDGDPVLAWMMTNLICHKNSKDQWMPDKGASKNKIDLAVSVLMAISECLFSEESANQWNFVPGSLGL